MRTRKAPNLDPQTAALLSACASRDRRLTAFRALGLIVLLGMGWTIGVGWIDRAIALPPLLRWMLLCMLMGLIGIVLIRTAARVFGARAASMGLVRRIEQRVPELRERLLTLQSRTPAGGEAFIGRLSMEVAELLHHQTARQLIPAAATRRAWQSAGVASALVAVFMLVGLMRSDALTRQWMPWRADRDAVQVTLALEPGDTRVLQGQPLRVSVRAQGLERTVVPVIRWSIDGGRWASASMTRSGDEQFAFVFQSLDRPMRYRIVAGSTESHEHHVAVAHRPAVAVMDAEVTYPAHLQRPPLRVTLDEPRLEMPAGSTLRLRVTATEPLASAVVEVGGRRLAASTTDAPEMVEISLPVDRDGAWQIELMSRDGIPSSRLAPLQLRAIPDEPPAARLPQRTIRATPATTLLLPYQAGDDLSLSSITLQLELRGKRLPDQQVPLVGDQRLQSGIIEIDLPSLGVRVGDELLARLEPRDIAGQTRRSEPAVIVIASEPHDAFDQSRIDALLQITALLRPLDGQKPEQVDASRLASLIRDAESLLRVAQLRARDVEAEPLALLADSLIISQEQLTVGAIGPALERVQRMLRDTRALMRRLEARAALGDLAAIEMLTGDANRSARERLTRDLRDRTRALEARGSGRDLAGNLRDIAGRDRPPRETDLASWQEAESASPARVLARARGEALRDRPEPSRLRALRRVGAGEDDVWTRAVVVEFDEDRRLLLSASLACRILSMLPPELAAPAVFAIEPLRPLDRPMLGWRAIAWERIAVIDSLNSTTGARQLVDALQPLRPVADPAIATLERRVIAALDSTRPADQRAAEVARSLTQLHRELEPVRNLLRDLDPAGDAFDARTQAIAAVGRGDRKRASLQWRRTADAIERFVLQRDIKLQVDRSQTGPHMRPLIDQLLELSRPRAEEMNLTLAAMRMWSMLRERAVRADPTRSRETDPAGYEEPIRLYFDAIERLRGGKR